MVANAQVQNNAPEAKRANAAKGKKQAQTQPAAPEVPQNPETSSSSLTVDAEGWSGDQQALMESAMKQFPASMPTKERWIAISGVVKDKSAKECFERFKSIVAKLKASQQR